MKELDKMNYLELIDYVERNFSLKEQVNIFIQALEWREFHISDRDNAIRTAISYAEYVEKEKNNEQ